MTYASFIQRKEKSVSRTVAHSSPYYMELPVTQIEALSKCSTGQKDCYRF